MKYLTCDQDIPVRLRRPAQDDTVVKIQRVFANPLNWWQLLGPAPPKFCFDIDRFGEQEEAYQQIAPILKGAFKGLISGWSQFPETEPMICNEQVQDHPEDFQL